MRKPIYKTSINADQKPIEFECTDCEWIGTHAEKKDRYIDVEYGIKEQICPICECNEFYPIIGYKDNRKV